jgi:hypothetical protein
MRGVAGLDETHRGVMMARSARFVVAIAVATGALFGAEMPAAAAAAPTVDYSRDGGMTWSAIPPPFLFSSTLRFVPGDVATAHLLIRSLRPDPTLMQVSLANAATTSSLLESALTVEGADAAGAGLAPTNFGALTTCQSVVPDRVLARGQVVSVSLTLRVSPTLSGRQAQDSLGYFDLALAMSDPGAPITANGCEVDPVLIPGTGDGPDIPRTERAGLAYTGATLAYPAIITALIALGVGWLFVLMGRRRRGSE